MRHSWEKDKPRKGFSTCRNCSLGSLYDEQGKRVEVKNYKIKKGGLPPCDPEKALKPKKIDCLNHEIAAISGALGCWNCGVAYTPAEREAGRIKRERNVENKIKEYLTEDTDISKNPPPSLYIPNKP